MKIYALYHNYYNFCDSWDTLVQLYLNLEDAENGQLLMEEAPHNGEIDSWYVVEMEAI